MRKKTIFFGSFLVIGVLFAVSVYASPQLMRKDDKDRTELRERVRMLRMWKLTEFLNLDEKTASLFFPILNKYDNERENLMKERREAVRELRKALRAEKIDPKNLTTLVDRINKVNDEFIGLSRREQAELFKVLTLEQQAKYILFRNDFEKKLGDMLRRSMDQRGGVKRPTHRRMPAPPPDEGPLPEEYF
jgi:hypothetical protein